MFGADVLGTPVPEGGRRGICRFRAQVADPDGNEFEIMWMLPRQDWGVYEHSAPIDHLDLAAEIQRWSGVPTAGHITAEPASDRS